MNEADILLAAAVDAARAAGALVREQYGTELQINEAHHYDLKIQLDVDTQRLIEGRLLAAVPGSAVLGEEGGAGSGGRGVEWIIDPIDGTVNLAYGIPHFCTSIAARVEGEIVAGVVLDPMRGESFTAVRGGGAFLNGRPIQVSPRTSVQEAILSLGFSKQRETVDHCLMLYAHYARAARKLRAMGSAALDLAYVASGRFDAYIEQGIKIWDIAAGVLLVREAGGRVDLVAKDEAETFHCTAWNGKMDFEKR